MNSMCFINKRFLQLFLINLLIIIFASISVSAFSGAGSGTINNPFQITNVAQLQEMNDNKSAHYVLVNNINAVSTASWNSGQGFVPIGIKVSSFSGSFNGKNFTISNLYITRNYTDNIGLFGYVNSGAVIRDVGLVNVYINVITTDWGVVGALAGYSNGSIINVNSTGIVRGGNDVFIVGGLVGENYGSIINSNSFANVSAGSAVGGLVGYNSGLIMNSYASGHIKGGSEIGGLVGTAIDKSNITNSYAKGFVEGVSGTRNWFGGLVGFGAGHISNSYASGNVSGNYAGGLIGWFAGNVRVVSNSYSTGRVTGNNNLGGLIGFGSGQVTNSFWDIQTSGLTTSVGGTGKTTVEMRNISTFSNAGWNIVLKQNHNGNQNSGIWFIENSVDYPRLWFEYKPPLDAVSPTFSLNQTNNSYAGLSTLFSVRWSDNVALHPSGRFIFSTNNSGVWVNDSAVYFTSTPSWGNVSKVLNSSVGVGVGFRWFAFDNAGNYASTPIYVLKTFHRADSNRNGCIEIGEISAFVSLWLNGYVSLQQVSGAVSIWLAGCN